MISYEPLWRTMKEKNITTYDLRHRHNFSSATVTRLSKNDPIQTTTIEKLCKILKCNVADILTMKSLQ